MQKSYYIELIKLSFPIVLTTSTIATINLLTIFILSKCGVYALAANAISSSFIIVIYNVFQASYFGFRTLASKAYGAKNLKDVNILFNTTLVFSLLIGALINLLIFISSNYVISFISKDKDVLLISSLFLKIGSFCYPFIAAYNTLSITLSLQKNTSINMYISIFTSIVGLAFSLIMVFGFYKIPPIGLLGIPLGTLFQSFITFLLYAAIFPKVSHNIVINFQFSYDQFYKLWKLSYPPMFSTFLDYLSNIVMFSMISIFLDSESLANGRIGFSILLWVFSLIVSSSIGFSIVGGQALGENNFNKFILYYKCNKRITLLLTIIISILLLITSKNLLNFLYIFKEINSLSYIPLIIIAIICPLMSWSYNNSLYLRLREYALTEMLCNLISLWFIQVPFSYYLGITLELKLNGFFAAFLIYELFYITCTTLIIHRIAKG